MASGSQVNNWIHNFPADAVEEEISDLLTEIDRLKEQVRRRREVLKIYRALEDSGGGSATSRIIGSTKTKGRDVT